MVADDDVCEYRLVRRPKPAVIDDNDTAIRQMPGEGHVPRPDRQHRLAGGTDQIDTAMA